jgi:hypothetical protein
MTQHACRVKAQPPSPPPYAHAGGQTEEEATLNLNEINRLAGQQGRAPWSLSFSFGRALQVEVMERTRPPHPPTPPPPPTHTHTPHSPPKSTLPAHTRSQFRLKMLAAHLWLLAATWKGPTPHCSVGTFAPYPANTTLPPLLCRPACCSCGKTMATLSAAGKWLLRWPMPMGRPRWGRMRARTPPLHLPRAH